MKKTLLGLFLLMAFASVSLMAGYSYCRPSLIRPPMMDRTNQWHILQRGAGANPVTFEGAISSDREVHVSLAAGAPVWGALDIVCGRGEEQSCAFFVFARTTVGDKR